MAILYEEILDYLFKHQHEEKDLFAEFSSKYQENVIKSTADELKSDKLITSKVTSGLNVSFQSKKPSRDVSGSVKRKLLAKITIRGIQDVQERAQKKEPIPTPPHKINLKYLRRSTLISIAALILTIALLIVNAINGDFFSKVLFSSAKRALIPPVIDITNDGYGFRLTGVTGGKYGGNLPHFMFTIRNSNSTAHKVKIRYAMFREWKMNLDGKTHRAILPVLVADSSKFYINIDKFHNGDTLKRWIQVEHNTIEGPTSYGYYLASVGKLVDDNDSLRHFFTSHKFTRINPNMNGDFRYAEVPMDTWEIETIKNLLNALRP